MRAFLTKLGRRYLIVLAGLLPLLGCGDSQRNDQGVTFRLNGWYQQPGTTFTDATGLTGKIIALSEANPEEFDGTAGLVDGYLGLENNLAGQFIRVQSAHHSYFIPGATIQPPDDVVGVSTTVGPQPDNFSDNFGNIDSTLPDGISNTTGNIAFAGVAMITPAVRAFLNLNREYFPEPPFTMIVTTFAQGVTSAGNDIRTNSIDFQVFVTSDVNITPPSGEAGSAGLEGLEEDVE